MRTEKQLLEVMLSNIHQLLGGLCYLNDRLYSQRIITSQEHAVISRYIRYNRPSMFSSWNAFENWGGRFYWSIDNIEHRVKWLNKHIKKLSKI
jgi:hypothetical protein